MIQKELLEEFKSAKWKTSEEMRAFVKKVGGVTPQDIASMMDLILSTRAKDSPEHAMRVRAFAETAAGISDKALFELYLKALKSDDRHLRSVMVNLFPNANNPLLLPKLCELLQSSDTNLRRVTSQILQKIADGNVIKVLGEMFVLRNFPGRNEAIDIASSSIRYHSVEFFKVVLSSGNIAEKIRVLKYLSLPDLIKNHPKSVSSTARLALSETDETVLIEAIQLFPKVCNEEEYFDYIGASLYHGDLRLVMAAVQGLRYFSSSHVAAALERKLHTGPHEIRMAVLETIEYIGTSDIQKPLVKALQHRNSTIQDQAFKVLKKLAEVGKIDVADAVIWLLTSNDPGVRGKSVAIVASISGNKEQLWEKIFEHLRKENYWVRQKLLEPLVEAGGMALIPYALKYLSDPHDIMCNFALDLLGRLSPPEALNALIALVEQGGEWWVREKAIGVIANIKDPRTITFLLDIASREQDFRVAVIDALMNIGSGSSADKVNSFLADGNPDVRLAALRKVVSFLADENPDVRFAALRFIDMFADPKQASIVLPYVKDQDIRVRHLSCTILDRGKVDYSSSISDEKKSIPLLDRLLTALNKSGGDDLILLPDNPAYMKKHGETIPVTTTSLPLSTLQSMIASILTPRQQEDLKNLNDVDFSYEVRQEGLRFRANIFSSHTGISAVFRIIKGDVWKLEGLGLPSVVGTFCDFKDGLVLVGGPTGSGKSTTLASIISNIISNSRRNVISIEDPIEVVHKTAMGMINQREVGVHTPTFNHALKMTLREDPDVILVGEMRDLTTIQFAVTAAETGHLVFGTVHTVSADSTVDRLINAYPPESQEQVRAMLADSLKAVFCQYLIRHKTKPERVLASEVMINNGAISNLIRKGKTFQIPSTIATSREQNMQLMDTSLMELFKAGKISAEEAYLKARNKTDFEDIAGIKTTPTASIAPADSNKYSQQKDKTK